jgi:hypothetical protein
MLNTHTNSRPTHCSFQVLEACQKLEEWQRAAKCEVQISALTYQFLLARNGFMQQRLSEKHGFDFLFFVPVLALLVLVCRFCLGFLALLSNIHDIYIYMPQQGAP